jgi:hypothetical protein
MSVLRKIGGFTCGGRLHLCDATFEQVHRSSPEVIDAVDSHELLVLSGKWTAFLVVDDENSIKELVLRHQAFIEGTEHGLEKPLWIHSGKLVVVDADARGDPDVRMRFERVRFNDYPMFEHDRVVAHGVVVTFASDAEVAVPIFVIERGGHAIGLRIHNPWDALLMQRWHNRMWEYFEAFSEAWNCTALETIMHDWDIYSPSTNEAPESRYPAPLFSTDERATILAYATVWKRALAGVQEYADLKHSPGWGALCEAGKVAWSIFRRRELLAENAEISTR